MERLRNVSPDELAEGAKALVEQYKKSAEEAKVEVADYVIGSIDAIFAGVEPPSSADAMKPFFDALILTLISTFIFRRANCFAILYTVSNFCDF